jgi:adiponectin receptor
LGEELVPLLLSFGYAGIGLLISGACVAPVYYGLYCMPGFVRGYLAAMAAACALATALTLQPRFRTEAYLLPRIGAFVVLALVCAVPLLHFAALPEARADPELRVVVQQLFLMMGLNALGTVFYATKLPERFVWPGSGAFDLLGASHQLFHACILASATVHWLNVLRHAAWRGAHAECPA